MDKEVKEIITRINKEIEKHIKEGYSEDMLVIYELDVLQWRILLDYITTLQQDVQEANDNAEWWGNRYKAVERDNQELKKKIDRRYYKNEYERIKQENEDNLKCIKSLKEQLESVINENQRLLKQWFENNDKTVELIGEKENYKQNFNDYKSRCEKASEDIKFCLHSIKQEYEMSIDERTRNEMESCVQIFNKTLNILQNGSDDNE